MSSTVYVLARLCEVEVRLLGVEVNNGPGWMRSVTWERDVEGGGRGVKTPTSGTSSSVRGQIDGKFFGGFETLI